MSTASQASPPVIEGLPVQVTKDGKPTSLWFALLSLGTVVAVLAVGLWPSMRPSR